MFFFFFYCFHSHPKSFALNITQPLYVYSMPLQVQQLFYQRDNISKFANKHFELLLLLVFIAKIFLLPFLALRSFFILVFINFLHSTLSIHCIFRFKPIFAFMLVISEVYRAPACSFWILTNPPFLMELC